MELHPLPHVVHVDDLDEPVDLVDGLLGRAFVSGEQPWSRAVELERVRPDAELLPPGATWARWARNGIVRVGLAVGDGWTLKVTRWSERAARLTVTAVDEAVGEAVLASAGDGAVEPPEEPEAIVKVTFWHRGCSGPVARSRTIAAPRWADIRRNYAGSVGTAFDALARLRPEDVSGRLLLFHGPPGTGKTTTLRALAREWRDWCRAECVLDPDRLLADAGYLMQVAAGDEDGTCDEDGPSRTWRLVVLEDCDELVRAGAKQDAGQGLSRLLNVTDGLMGQGLDLLVVLTTNEPLARLHPAVVRPGRCLAEIEVGRLSRAEAAAWLGTGRGIGPEGATLAELYALRGATATVRRSRPAKVAGLYL